MDIQEAVVESSEKSEKHVIGRGNSCYAVAESLTEFHLAVMSKVQLVKW